MSQAEPRQERGTIHLDVALQGGGAHGAFTWGVLDRLLLEEHIRFDGISGTSAGAVNAAALAAGLNSGGREEARAGLRRVWETVGRLGSWLAEPGVALTSGTPLEPWARAAQAWQRAWLATLGPVSSWPQQAALVWNAAWSAAVSPYESNPWDLNPLRYILAETIDFDAVRNCTQLQLFIAATEVRTGRLRLFGCHETTIDVVLASGCLPTLFQAVHIDGQPYWDGGYAGNPALLPLVAKTVADDVLIVQINPAQRPREPRTATEILDRMNEIVFNATLLKDLRTLALMRRLLQTAGPAPTPVAPGSDAHGLRRLADSADGLARVANLRLHCIDGGNDLAELSPATKAAVTLSSVTQLHDLGWEHAQTWLARHRDDLGARATLDLDRYLDITL